MSLSLQIARTALLKPQPGDVLVVTMNRDITDGEAEVLRKRGERALSAHPGISILFVGRHDRVTVEAHVPEDAPEQGGQKPAPETAAKPEPKVEATAPGDGAGEAPTAAPAGDPDDANATETAAEAEGTTAKPHRRRASTGGKKAAKAAAGTKAGA